MILTFEVEQKKLIVLEDICKNMKQQLKKAVPADYMQPLGVLTEIDGFPKSGQFYFGAPFKEEMLVLSGMTSEEIDLFLAAYRASGAEPIALKAVVTPVNVFWTPFQLFEELQKERNSFGNR